MTAPAHRFKSLEQAAQSYALDAFALQRLLESADIAVTFAHDQSMHVVAKEVCGLALTQRSATVTSGYLGLTGATSPLPEETLSALQDSIDCDEGQDLAQWVRLVEHRLLQLLHQGVSKATFDANVTQSLQDAPSAGLLSYTHHAAPVLPRLRLATWAALKKAQSSVADVVWAMKQVLLQHHIEADVRLMPMAGRPSCLEDAQCSRLGETATHLGMSFVLGPYALAPQRSVRIELLPHDSTFFCQTPQNEDALAKDVGAVLSALLPPFITAEVVARVPDVSEEGFRLDATAPEQFGTMPVSRRSRLRGLGVSTHLAGAPRDTHIPWPCSAAEHVETSL